MDHYPPKEQSGPDADPSSGMKKRTIRLRKDGATASKISEPENPYLRQIVRGWRYVLRNNQRLLQHLHDGPHGKHPQSGPDASPIKLGRNDPAKDTLHDNNGLFQNTSPTLTPASCMSKTVTGAGGGLVTRTFSYVYPSTWCWAIPVSCAILRLGIGFPVRLLAHRHHLRYYAMYDTALAGWKAAYTEEGYKQGTLNGWSRWRVQWYTMRMMRRKQAIIARHYGYHPALAFLLPTVFGAATWVTLAATIRRMSAFPVLGLSCDGVFRPAPGMKTEGWFWCPDLSLPDPLGALPAVAVMAAQYNTYMIYRRAKLMPLRSPFAFITRFMCKCLFVINGFSFFLFIRMPAGVTTCLATSFILAIFERRLMGNIMQHSTATWKSRLFHKQANPNGLREALQHQGHLSGHNRFWGNHAASNARFGAVDDSEVSTLITHILQNTNAPTQTIEEKGETCNTAGKTRIRSDRASATKSGMLETRPDPMLHRLHTPTQNPKRAASSSPST